MRSGPKTKTVAAAEMRKSNATRRSASRMDMRRRPHALRESLLDSTSIYKGGDSDARRPIILMSAEIIVLSAVRVSETSE